MKTMLKPGHLSGCQWVFFLIFFFGSVQISYSQKALSTSGGTASNEFINVDFSFGQVFIQDVSNSRVLTCEGVLRPKEIPKRASFNSLEFDVYPNPIMESFRVTFKDPERIHKVTVRNSQGAMLQEHFSGFEDMECTLPCTPGIYFLIVTSDEGETNKTLIKL